MNSQSNSVQISSNVKGFLRDGKISKAQYLSQHPLERLGSLLNCQRAASVAVGARRARSTNEKAEGDQEFQSLVQKHFWKVGNKVCRLHVPLRSHQRHVLWLFFLVSQAICVTRQIQIQCQYIFHFSSYHKTPIVQLLGI